MCQKEIKNYTSQFCLNLKRFTNCTDFPNSNLINWCWFCVFRVLFIFNEDNIIVVIIIIVIEVSIDSVLVPARRLQNHETYALS